MILLDPGMVPPGGFKVFVPETKAEIGSSSYKGLRTALLNHFQANGIPVPADMDSETQNRLCARMPPGICIHGDGSPVHGPHRLTWEQVKAGAQAYGSWILKGGLVPLEEANRRARICADCPFNQEVEGCTSCMRDHMATLLATYVLNRKTDYDDYLKSCATCGCPLKISVNAPLEINVKHMPQDMKDKLPAHCWKKV